MAVGSEFVHLHVASSFSMRYGSSTPEALVERAVQLGQSTLGLTDRDGAYGAVPFAQACARAEVSAVLGVDLAVVEPPVTGPGAGSGARSGAGHGGGHGGRPSRFPDRPLDARIQAAGVRWTGADAF